MVDESEICFQQEVVLGNKTSIGKDRAPNFGEMFFFSLEISGMYLELFLSVTGNFIVFEL